MKDEANTQTAKTISQQPGSVANSHWDAAETVVTTISFLIVAVLLMLIIHAFLPRKH